MTGKIVIEGVESGLKICCNIKGVSLEDKFQILSTIEDLLDIDETLSALYNLVGRKVIKEQSTKITITPELYELMGGENCD